MIIPFITGKVPSPIGVNGWQAGIGVGEGTLA